MYNTNKLSYILIGVENVEIDMRMSKVTVFGYVDRRKVLKAVRKTGKRAEFWQEAFNRFNNYSYYNNDDDFTRYHSHSYNYDRPLSYTGNHVLQRHAFQRTYNYEKHGYNNYNYMNDEGMPLYEYGSTSLHDQAPSLFSDENPNACSIM